MAHTDPSPTTQISHGETSGDQPSQMMVLDPPTFSFTRSNLRPSTGRTSITQVEEQDDDEQLLAPESTSQDVASSTSNVTHHQASEEPISNLSQDQQQSVQQPSTPSTQPQTISQTVPQMPQTYLTFLLISGRRRTMSFEPESPIGRVKELAWNSWPTDWQDERPPAPSYMRVLYLGKMLQDDETLIGLKLPMFTPTSSSSSPIPTIMHLSIRPFLPPSEGDLKKKKKRNLNGDFTGTNNGDMEGSENNCCHCVIS